MTHFREECSVTDDDTSCNPTVLPQSVLFAYSNDLSPQTVSDAFLALETLRNNWCVELSWFGSVRFDFTGNIDIVFNSGFEDINSTILNNLPNPNQGFQNSSIGSNVFDVIEKFFSNTQATVCGSIIVILLKRYPNESDTSRLVSLIRSHHAFVHVITSTTPSGGSQPKAMYSVASKTNGMGAFECDENFRVAIQDLPLSDFVYPVYATTIQVSGSGVKTLPDLYNDQLAAWIAITYEDHVSDGSFQNLTLRWTNPQSVGGWSVNSCEVSQDYAGGTYIAILGYFYQFNYSMSLDYNYSGQDVQNLQIRIYADDPLNNWLPYSD